MREHSIYVVTCSYNDKAYVGRTCNGVEKRWKRHVYDASKGLPLYFYHAILKHGAENFHVTEVAKTDDFERACELESLFILLLRSHDHEFGYNSTFGGDGGGIPTEETRQKYFGRASWNLGRTPPLKTRLKISQTLMGKLVGDKNPFYGKKHSPETREHLGNIQRGLKRKPCSDSTKKKIRQRMLGRQFSPETLQKMRDAKLGKPQPESQRNKAAESQKLRRARERSVSDITDSD